MPASNTPLREEVFEHGPVVLRMQMPPSADELIDEDAFARDERLPYWADLWPSSKALSRWLIDQPRIAGPVIELGCGMGLPSLVLRLMGVEVLATDYETEALDCVRANTAFNRISDLATRVIDWREANIVERPFDLAVGADLLYEQRNAIALANFLPRVVVPGGRFIVADPGRRWLPQFKLLMRERGWATDELAAIIEPGTNAQAKPTTVRIIEFRAPA
jgi:predicted nicotinamide N-methyase